MVNLTVCQKKSLSLKKANININLLELTEDNMIQTEKQIKKDFKFQTPQNTHSSLQIKREQ